MTDISVVIPARIQSDERASVFLKALYSLSRQTLPSERYEVVIVDDGSDIPLDNVLKGSPWHNVFLIRQPKMGPSAARNKGVRFAKSGLILFLGSDIIVRDNLLKAHIDAHKKHRDCIMVNHVYASKNARLGKESLEMRLEGITEDAEREMPAGREFYTACVSIKKDLMEKEPFDENFFYAAYEDTDLGYRLHKIGVRFVNIGNTSAVHEHIHTAESLMERSKNCGRAFSYLSRKHPKLNVGIRVKSGLVKSNLKEGILLSVYTLFKTLNISQVIPVPAWALKMMCSYCFLEGVREEESSSASSC